MLLCSSVLLNSLKGNQGNNWIIKKLSEWEKDLGYLISITEI